MKQFFYFFLLTLSVSIFSCKKETSLENSSGDHSSGSLQSDASGECLPKNVQGAYIAGTALGAANFIEVDIDVVKEGTYAITTDTANGYYFSANGKFDSTGINTVKLIGKGKPLAQGSDYFIITYDSTTCEVQVDVLPSTASGPASFGLQPNGTDCMKAVPAGTYTKGTALTSANKVTIDVNVSAIGTYSVSTATVNGIKFSGAGAFSATGIQTITLTGSGTPTNAGLDTIPITAGSTSCSFQITVNNSGTLPPPVTGTYFWKFSVGATTYQGTVDITDAIIMDTTVGAFTFKTFYFEATDSADDNAMSLTLADASGGINANENYTSPPSGTNSVYFAWEDSIGDLYETSTSPFTAKVTSHNTTTKVIKGTFSGTAKNILNTTTKTITGGVFEVNYQ
jgi:hypothetical protein